MTFSALTNQQRISSQSSSREGAQIDHVILHHSATTNVEEVLDMMVSGSREVSSNYVIGNDGTIYGVVPEELRAWTSGSSTDGGQGAAWDRRSITFECADLSTDGWTISDPSYESIAQVCADVAKRYGFSLVRAGSGSTVFGHKELYTYFGASYATACPGGMDVDRVVARANEILSGAQPDTQEEDQEMAKVIKRESTGVTYGLFNGRLRSHASDHDRQMAMYILYGPSGLNTPATDSRILSLSDGDFSTVLWEYGLQEFADLKNLPKDGSSLIASWVK